MQSREERIWKTHSFGAPPGFLFQCEDSVVNYKAEE
jgi:hypothetical protein